MKRVLIMLVGGSLVCGCSSFGTFKSLEKGQTTSDEVHHMLGEPANTLYRGEEEVWQYRFVETPGKVAGGAQATMDLGITFKDDKVSEYEISASKTWTREDQKEADRLGRRGKPDGRSVPSRSGRDNAFIMRHDRNNDGRISRQEFLFPAEVFDRLDRNKDGYIDDSEAPSRGAPDQRQRR